MRFRKILNLFGNIGLIIVIVTSLAISGFSKPILPKFFSDHMVLQREKPIQIWGWDSPGSSVTICFAGNNIVVNSGNDGKWSGVLPSLNAGGPYDLKVESDEEVVISDILIGDVWIAGGQSNMEWQLSWTVNNWEVEVAESNLPQIRFFQVPKTYSFKPLDTISSGNWMVASPETTGNFSAVAWFFAKRNHLEKNVPVGVIECNWGGTPAEAWTSIETLSKTSGYREAAKKVISPEIPWAEFFKINKANDSIKWALIGDKSVAIKSGAANREYNDQAWKNIILPSSKPLSDIAWFRKSFDLADGYDDTVSLFIGNIVQEAMLFVNGNLLWEKTWKDTSSIIQIPPDYLETKENIIALRIINSWDNKVQLGSQGQMWVRFGDQKISLEGEWSYSNDVEPRIPEVKKMFWEPSFLFNGMVNPLAGFHCKGFIWYQGESNVDKADLYNELFSNMINDWRNQWGDSNLPFLFVQLANYLDVKPEPSESDWAKLREAQFQTLSSVDFTGMATTIDIGVANDIHPRNKQDVGHRLWLAAKQVAFNESLISTGPTYLDHKIKGSKVIIKYENVGEALMTANGGPPMGFAIAGADKKFYWAKAELNGKQIILSTPKVKNPVAIRYAWADNPETNLYNLENLPAIPFRTDNW